MKLADRSQPLWKTTWNNFGPRLGFAYQLGRADGKETVVRAGAGIFYDTGNTEGSRGYWYATGISHVHCFQAIRFRSRSLNSTACRSRALSALHDIGLRFRSGSQAALCLAVEREHRTIARFNQTLTTGYLGSAGRRLTAQRQYFPDRVGNTNFGPTFGVYLTDNAGQSDYHALQVKFQRRLSHGLQGLVSYTWSHGIDNSTSNFQLYQLLRASSDFDIRHNLQIAATYDIPSPVGNRILSGWASGWAVDTRISARTALPVDLLGGTRVDAATGGNIQFHPNWVAGQPVYVADANAPGGRRINFDAFVAAPANQEGNVGRNVARAFATSQTDITLRKEFRITEGSNLQFRAEAFNVFNRANSAPFITCSRMAEHSSDWHQYAERSTWWTQLALSDWRATLDSACAETSLLDVTPTTTEIPFSTPQPAAPQRVLGLTRKSLFKVHGWLGMVFGSLLFVICASGAAAALSYEIDWLLNPALRVSPTGKPALSWGAWMEAARVTHPDWKPRWVTAPPNRYTAVEIIEDAPSGLWRRVYR